MAMIALRKVLPAALLLVGLAGFSTPAWAYLDPSTGSMILSAIVGLFATAGLALKTYWYRLKGLFRRRQPAEEQPERPEEAEPVHRDPSPER